MRPSRRVPLCRTLFGMKKTMIGWGAAALKLAAIAALAAGGLIGAGH
jgi:hypothetical protein